MVKSNLKVILFDEIEGIYEFQSIWTHPKFSLYSISNQDSAKYICVDLMTLKD